MHWEELLDTGIATSGRLFVDGFKAGRGSILDGRVGGAVSRDSVPVTPTSKSPFVFYDAKRTCFLTVAARHVLLEANKGGFGFVRQCPTRSLEQVHPRNCCRLELFGWRSGVSLSPRRNLREILNLSGAASSLFPPRLLLVKFTAPRK